MNNYVLDESGTPVIEPDLLKWGEWYQDAKNRRVAEDTRESHRVSTVFLAMDHGCGEDGPLLYETMIFAAGGQEGACGSGEVGRRRCRACRAARDVVVETAFTTRPVKYMSGRATSVTEGCHVANVRFLNRRSPKEPKTPKKRGFNRT